MPVDKTDEMLLQRIARLKRGFEETFGIPVQDEHILSWITQEIEQKRQVAYIKNRIGDLRDEELVHLRGILCDEVNSNGKE